MKILLLTTHLNIGGITSYTVSLAKALKLRGEEAFVASSGGILVSELSASGISHISIDMKTKSEISPKVFKAIFEVSSIVKRLKIDVIHSQTRVTQVIGFFASRLSGIKFVSTCHGFFDMNVGRFLLPAWGDRVIAISEAVKKHLITDFKVPESRISLIYNGIDVKRFLRHAGDSQKEELRHKFGLKKEGFVLGTISRFTADKGYDVLLYAMKEILKKEKNVQMVFVGDGKEKGRIVELSRRLGLSEHVVFISPQINTVNILSVMDVFMFTPVRKEGLGLVVLEAMASSKVVVATDVGGIPSIIKDKVNGFLVEPGKPELLVEPVLSLLNDKELYKKMAKAGIETVVNKFSIEGMVEKVMEVYGNQVTSGY